MCFNLEINRPLYFVLVFQYVFFFIDFKLGLKTVSSLFDLFLFIDFFLLGVRGFLNG